MSTEEIQEELTQAEARVMELKTKLEGARFLEALKSGNFSFISLHTAEKLEPAVLDIELGGGRRTQSIDLTEAEAKEILGLVASIAERRIGSAS
jgi:hypothetical protein